MSDVLVWAYEGGIEIHVARQPNGAAKFSILEAFGIETRILATATVAAFRLPRIVAVLGVEARPRIPSEAVEAARIVVDEWGSLSHASRKGLADAVARALLAAAEEQER
jgi:hypothetical protein